MSFERSQSCVPDFSSLQTLVSESKSIVEEIAKTTLKFKHEEAEKHYLNVHEQILNFKAQLSQFQAILEGKTIEPADLLPEHNLHIKFKDDICLNIVGHFLEYIDQNFLQDLKTNFLEAKQEGPSTKFVESLMIAGPKLQALVRFFPAVVKYDKSDLFALPDDHPTWQLLKQHAKTVELKSPEEMKKSFDRFLNLVYTGAAMTKFGSKFKQHHPYIFHTLKLASGAYYMLFKSKAKKIAELFYSESSHDAFGTWDIMDMKYAVPFFEMTFTPIETNQILYLPRQYPSITKDLVKKAVAHKVWDDKEKPFFDKDASFPFPNSRKFSLKELKIKDPNDLKIRVLSPNQLEEGGLFSFCTKRKRPTAKYDKLILHLHGGGWVGTSTAMHQIYLRHWAKMLNAPVFSVDYRLAPKHGYPDALDDCWQFYNWLLDNCDMFGIDPQKVIVAGDSAGGNMALSLSVLAHKSKRREPDGLLLAYPGLSLRKTVYSPSLLKAVNDHVVPFTLLELCLEEYIKDYEHSEIDPLIHPILHHDEMLKLLPPIQIIVGDQDPTYDECWRFLNKMLKLGKEVDLTIFKDMMHGCLNFDMIMGMPEAHSVVKHCAGLINKLTEKKTDSDMTNITS